MAPRVVTVLPRASDRVDVETELARVERLAELLDSWFVIPGTSIRVGLDSIVGLVPGVGDTVMLIAGLHIIERLSRLGVSQSVRLRMYGNVLIDFLVGAIPVLGDIFDVAFKANVRNLQLARRALLE